MFYADTLGIDTVVQKLEALSESTGDSCWEPAELLRELAGGGGMLGALNHA